VSNAGGGLTLRLPIKTGLGWARGARGCRGRDPRLQLARGGGVEEIAAGGGAIGGRLAASLGRLHN
jgi:hypothetical protein